MTATIMMVTYNRLDLTKETLDNLISNTDYPFHLIIVDNGSTDGTKDWLSTLSAEKSLLSVKIHYNNENKGIAIGRNQALALASPMGHDWFVTLDNDVWVPKGWLTEAVDILKHNRQYGAIGVNMENVRYPTVTKGAKTFQDKPRGNLGTACMVFNRSLHKMLGYFNHLDYKLYAHEDADLGMRTRIVGLKLGYIQEMGKHVGEGDRDIGEYREFKNEWHAANLAKFNANCRDYSARRKPIYIDFENE